MKNKRNVVDITEAIPSEFGKRINIQFSSDQIKHLEWLAKTQQITQSEAVRRALATESYLRQALQRGAQFLIKEGDSIKEVVFR